MKLGVSVVLAENRRIRGSVHVRANSAAAGSEPQPRRRRARTSPNTRLRRPAARSPSPSPPCRTRALRWGTVEPGDDRIPTRTPRRQLRATTHVPASASGPRWSEPPPDEGSAIPVGSRVDPDPVGWADGLATGLVPSVVPLPFEVLEQAAKASPATASRAAIRIGARNSFSSSARRLGRCLVRGTALRRPAASRRGDPFDKIPARPRCGSHAGARHRAFDPDRGVRGHAQGVRPQASGPRGLAGIPQGAAAGMHMVGHRVTPV